MTKIALLHAAILCTALTWSIQAAPDTAQTFRVERDRQFDELQRQIEDRHNWDNERLANEVHRPEALLLEEDRTPVDVVWRRTQALLHHLQQMDGAPDLAQEAAALRAMSDRVEAVRSEATPDEAVVRQLFRDIAAVRRQIAFANPLLDFDQILFIKRHRALFNHMCDQYYGMAARPGGGLYVLEDAFGSAPRVRDVLAGSVVESGRLEGQSLRGGVSPNGLRYDGRGRLHNAPTKNGGAFLSPDLSFDGRQILFSFVEGTGNPQHRYYWGDGINYWTEHWDPGRAFHVFKVNVDGSGLQQLTDGPWNDMHACPLPTPPPPASCSFRRTTTATTTDNEGVDHRLLITRHS